MRRKLAVGAVAVALAFGASVSPASAKPNPAKEQCKNGGWMTMVRADGSSFGNQGDCVSYGAQGNAYGTPGGGGGGEETA